MTSLDPLTWASPKVIALRGVTGVAALVLLLGLAACASPAPAPEPTAPSGQADGGDSPAPPRFYPDGTAEDNLPYFTKTLQDYASGQGAVEGRPIVDAIAEAGFDKGSMQVSFDRTQTALVADSIYVSVRLGTECLIGQIQTSDRSVSAVAEPAVGPSDDICLIGKTRPIDW